MTWHRHDSELSTTSTLNIGALSAEEFAGRKRLLDVVHR